MYSVRPLIILVATTFLAGPLLAGIDPTRPSDYRVVGQKKIQYVLESILIGEQRKVAVINGKALVEGEEVTGARVVSIEKEKVRIIKGGRVIDLEPRRTSIRREK